MFQPREHHNLTHLLNLTGQKDFVKDSIDLVEIKDQVQFTHVPKELIENLDEEMDGFEVGEFIVGTVNTDAEE